MSDAAVARLDARFLAFVAERFPFALDAARRALANAYGTTLDDAESIRLRGRAVREAFRETISWGDQDALGETTPGVPAAHRLEAARAELLDAVDGLFERLAIAQSLTADERREILRGMILTRTLDNRLKRFFTSGEVRFRDLPFQGKGFRSLGQEAVYAAAIRLHRGSEFSTGDEWSGDVVGPIIRDLGVALAMHCEPATVRMVLNAQMAKSGPPMDGHDLHIGDFAHGILPATAPLAISTVTLVGMAFAFARERLGRVAVSFIGDGGASLGEWHEAINAAAVHRLPMVFCVENNQIALSTSVSGNSVARVYADKASGYGIPGVTIDGTDPDDIAGAFTWAAERSRSGRGPALIELVSMRMSGHAHHDDMLYFGAEPPLTLDYPSPSARGGYVDRKRYALWREKDPIATYAARLEAMDVISSSDVIRYKEEAEALVEREAEAVVRAPWPSKSRSPFTAAPTARPENRKPGTRLEVTAALPWDAEGHTFLEAIALGLADAMRADPRVFLYGEDVARPYGNAFLALRSLLDEFTGRIVNSPLAEGAVIGVCIGSALAGLRPVGELQFNDFVAIGFDQLVNNAAKLHFRWGASVPMVLRMPWGGLRHAGPYHSQNTEAWFYRTPGLKIVAPSTPEDARALLAAAIADPDPVLFYEHIALYRDPRIRQRLPAAPPSPSALGTAALRRAGDDLVIISYGAYVHVAMRVAERLAAENRSVAVLDLRSLVPLDHDAVLSMARHCNRALIVHEDTRTGGIGESIAAVIQEEAFDWLDAPIRIIGAMDTPVPYSPPLEEAFLPSEEAIEQAARELLRY